MVRKKKKIAIYFTCLKYQKTSLKILNKEFSLKVFNNPSCVDSIKVKNADILFCPLGYNFFHERLSNYKKLKVVASNTTGHPHIDIDYCRKNKIKVITLKKKKKFLKAITATPELTMGLILAITRNIPASYNSVLEGKWSRWEFGGNKMLSSMTIGIIGLGRIGSQVAKYSKAFGMKVYYYDPYKHSKKFKKEKKLVDLVKKVDILSIHVPHEKETEKLINCDIFNSMKKNSYLINTARGEIIDWVPLLKNLKNKKLAGVALDVFDGEFNEKFSHNLKRHPFFEYAKRNQNVIITPHIGGSTIESWQKTEIETINSIINFFKK